MLVDGATGQTIPPRLPWAPSVVAHADNESSPAATEVVAGLGVRSIGATGFEPATSCSRSRRSTGLSYAPLKTVPPHAPRRTRTSNLLIRSQMLYPIELWAQTRPTLTPARYRGKHHMLLTHRDPHNLPAAQQQPHGGEPPWGHGSYKTRTCDLHDVNVAL